MSHELMTLSKYDKALALCETIEQINDLQAKAAGIIEYARQAKDQEMFNLASEMRLRAGRRAGELIIKMKASGEMVKNQQGQKRESVKDLPVKNVPLKALEGLKTLDEQGITHYQSSNWQALARITEEDFEKYLAHCKENNITPTMVSAKRLNDIEKKNIEQDKLIKSYAKEAKRELKGQERKEADRKNLAGLIHIPKTNIPGSINRCQEQYERMIKLCYQVDEGYPDDKWFSEVLSELNLAKEFFTRERKAWKDKLDNVVSIERKI